MIRWQRLCVSRQTFADVLAKKKEARQQQAWTLWPLRDRPFQSIVIICLGLDNYSQPLSSACTLRNKVSAGSLQREPPRVPKKNKKTTIFSSLEKSFQGGSTNILASFHFKSGQHFSPFPSFFSSPDFNVWYYFSPAPRIEPEWTTDLIQRNDKEGEGGGRGRGALAGVFSA